MGGFVLMILCTVLLLFFSNEISKLIKNILKIPGIKLFLPFIIITSIIVCYEPWIYWMLSYIKYALSISVQTIKSLLPFKTISGPIISVLLIAGLTILFQVLFNRPKKNLPFSFNWFLGTLVWVFFVILWVL
jgi:hypothetical protein